MKNIKTRIAAVMTGLVTMSAGVHGLAEHNDEQKKEKITDVVSAPESFSSQDTVLDETVAETPRVLNIGDSRTVGMYFAENMVKYSNEINALDTKGDIWFAKVGQGLKWFEKNLDIVQKHAKNSNIVALNLGINDLASGSSDNVAQKYLSIINKLAETWHKEGKLVFFSSINPVGPQYNHAQIFNQKIDNFNRIMKSNLSSDITFIDTNTFIKDKLQGKDFDKYGLHYVSAVNKSIHSYINSEITKQWDKKRNKMNYAQFVGLQKSQEK